MNFYNSNYYLTTHSRKYDNISPILKELHWLPVEERIIFKNLLLVKKILSNEAPLYLSDFVEFYVRIMDGETLEFLLRFYGMTYLFLLDKPNPLIILKSVKTHLFVRHFR